MSYIRFWWRCCIVFAPLFFFVLYFGAHVSLKYSLLSVIVMAVGGLLLISPFLLSFGRVDRSLWSEEEYRQRLERRKEKMAEWEEES